MSSNPSINSAGDKLWYDNNGNLHRENGPATIRKNGVNEWFYYGKLHRIGGPAVYNTNNNEYYEYYEFGKLHRMDGPAICHGKHKEWYVADKLHRLDGPAIIYPDGAMSWYYNDIKIHCETQEEFIRLLNLKAFW